MIKPANYTELYPVLSAKITQVQMQESDDFDQGSHFLQLQLPELDYDIRRTELDIKSYEKQLRSAYVSRELMGSILPLKEKLTFSKSKLQGLLDQRLQLQTHGQYQGKILDTDDSLYPGRWVDRQTQLAYLGDLSAYQIVGYVQEKDIARIQLNTQARFYYQDGLNAPVDVRFSKIAKTQSDFLDEPNLASIFGGSIAVRSHEDALIPEQAIYQVTFTPLESEVIEPQDRILKGEVRLKADQQSILTQIYKSVVSVLIRESGF